MAMGQRLKNSLAELLFGFLSLVLILVFCFLDWINIRSVLLIPFISSILVISIFVQIIDFRMLLPFDLEKQYLCEMLDFTKWVFMGATAVYFINWGDNLVLRYFVSMQDIGVYNLGYQFFKGMAVLFSTLGAYFLPFVSENIDNPIKIRDYLYGKRLKLFMGGAIALAFIFFLFPCILSIIYGKSYEGCTTVVRILLIAAAMHFYSVFYVSVFNASKTYKFLYIANVFQVLINIIMNVVLIPPFGIFGAALATVLAYVCKAILLETFFRIKLGPQLGVHSEKIGP